MTPSHPLDGGPSPLRRFALPALFVLGLFALLWLRAPTHGSSAGEREAVFDGRVMGTTWKVKVIAAKGQDPSPVQRAAAEALMAVDREMSTYKPDSLLMRLNRQPVHKPLQISASLRRVLLAAAEVSQRSGGAFDITVGSLVDAWGFGPKGAGQAPDAATIQRLRAQMGWQKLKLGPMDATRTTEGLRLDLSAIAKGFGADEAARAVEALGFHRYMVEVGGEVCVKGKNLSGQPWQLGVEKPDTPTREAITVLGLSSGAMATSGDYRKYREVDGKRVSHSIDPRTGRPITHQLASVSVLADDCMTADAWATALSVLGPKEGLEIAEREGIAAYMLVRQGNGFDALQSSHFRSRNENGEE
ncbi:MAG: hypothetical protein CSA62_11365 [Planctomycetota bacterium]|nr:MAG: hypothetical protein CSA62_11365 [Planctomycetota bacterium]